MLTVIVFIGVVTAMLEMIVFMRIPLLQQAAAKNYLVTLVLSLLLAKLICGLFHASGVIAAAGAMTGFVFAQGYYTVRGAVHRAQSNSQSAEDNSKSGYGYVMAGAIAASTWLLRRTANHHAQILRTQQEEVYGRTDSRVLEQRI